MSFDVITTAEQIESFTADGYWGQKLLTDFLDEAVASVPDRVAFVDPRRSVTFAELDAEARRCALGLRELGVEPGDVVSVQLPNWIEFVTVHLALTRIGAILNPLIPIYREREVGYMVGLAESKVIIAPSAFRDFDYIAMIEGLRGDWPALQHVLVVDAEDRHVAAGHLSFEEFMATPWEERRDQAELTSLRPGANDVTLLIFTSGTTGEPKGAMHTHNSLVAANAPIRERMGLTDESVIHMASTFAHLTGFLYGARLGIQNHLTTVVQAVWDVGEFLELVAEHRISYTSAATPFLLDLINNLPEDTSRLTSLTRFSCMGAAIPRVAVRQAKERLPSMAVLGGWGQTENGLVTIGIPGDSEEKITTTDGYPWPGMEVRTIDGDGHPVPAGSEGRIQVRGPFLFAGYAKRLEMTRTLFDDGWFDTGDLGVIDEDGYLSLSGRTKDLIVRGGENIPVAYVENVLYENPDFASVAVVAVPDPRLQEKACACVVLAPGVGDYALADLTRFLADKGVAKNYWPERLEVLEEFPVTPSGKIQKFQLRQQLSGQGGT